MANDQTNQTAPPSLLHGPRLVSAIVVLALFALFVGYMVWLAPNAGDTAWSRVDSIYTGVEAIAFGAAGAVFGTTIQRDRVVKAEADAATERTRADQSAVMATRGETLAKLLKADVQPAPVATGPTFRGETPAAPDPALARHAAWANELFPGV
jgi:hypothetical protein